MEKLLHERLREWEDNGDGTYSVLIENADVRTTKSALMALSDEIERNYVPRKYHKEELRKAHRGCAKPLKFINRGIALGQDWVEPQEGESFKHYIDRCYIPRPRYEDGEPVSKGCEVEGGIVDGWCVWDDGAFTLNDEEGNILQEAEPGEFVKRPTHKVYDADGVEIKVMDKGWLNYKEHEMLEIKAIHPKGSAPGYNCDYVEYSDLTLGKAKYFTHERPVFDAEGVRICKGDTVWHVLIGDKHIVEELTVDGRIYTDRSSLALSGDMFTHREPDSIQKVVDDMDASLRGMNVCDLQGYIDRLTALIERGA